MTIHSNVKQRENRKHSRVMKHKVRSSYKAGQWSYGGNSQCELGRSREGNEKRLPGKGGGGELVLPCEGKEDLVSTKP